MTISMMYPINHWPTELSIRPRCVIYAVKRLIWSTPSPEPSSPSPKMDVPWRPASPIPETFTRFAETRDLMMCNGWCTKAATAAMVTCALSSLPSHPPP